LLLSAEERAELERWTRRATSAQALALRARIVLACAGPEVPPIVAVARELRVTADTVRKWRRRFLTQRLDGPAEGMKAVSVSATRHSGLDLKSFQNPG
jgi:transposase-like protein